MKASSSLTSLWSTKHLGSYVLVIVLLVPRIATPQSYPLGKPEADSLDKSDARSALEEVVELCEANPDSAIRWLDGFWAGMPHFLRQEMGARYWMQRARAEYNRVDMVEAMRDCDSAMALVRERDFSMKAEIMRMRGQVFTWCGSYALASESLENALGLCTRMKDAVGMAACHQLLGWVHYRQGLVPSAKGQWLLALGLSRLRADRKGEAEALKGVGLACYHLGDSTSGAAYGDSTLWIAREIGEPRLLGAIHNNIGYKHAGFGRMKLARVHLDSALYFARMGRDDKLAYSIIHSMGSRCVQAGLPGEALQHCGQVLAFAQSKRLLVLERDAYQCIANAYRLQGDWKRAYEMMQRFHDLNWQVVSADSRDNVMSRSLTAEYERREFQDSIVHMATVERLEHESSMQHLRADRNQVRALALGSGAAVFLLGGFVVYRVDSKRRRERFERDVARMETQVLRTQMNPHFIFNALNSINHYVQENERDLASGFLTKFARLMRLVLESSRGNEVPLAQELETLRLYMDLEQARMNNRFRYEVGIDPAIDQESIMVPPLVLQPFVENAIWHGLSRKEGAGLLRVQVKQVDGALLMTVEDDGVGRGKDQSPANPDAPPRTSMGTGITRERLEMLGKQRGAEAGFRYVEVPQGTRVELRLPLAQETHA